jgi:hypothetical protein
MWHGDGPAISGAELRVNETNIKIYTRRTAPPSTGIAAPLI